MREQGPTRIFQTKVFARLARSEGVGVAGLVQCVTEAESGLIEAELGRGLIKQRLARAGEGKSGGVRTVIVFRNRDRAVFIDMFAKKDKANFTLDELNGYRKLAGILLGLSDAAISEALKSGALIEIRRDGGEHGEETQKRSTRRHP